MTLVDCDHVVQKKVELAHDTINWCLVYLCAEADPDLLILNSTEEGSGVMFGTRLFRN